MRCNESRSREIPSAHSLPLGLFVEVHGCPLVLDNISSPNTNISYKYIASDIKVVSSLSS